MKKTTGFVIIHYNQNKSEPTVRPLSETSFHKIKDTIKVRQSQVLLVKNHTKYVPKYLIYSHYICMVTGTIGGATETTNISKLIKKHSSDDAPSISKRWRTSQQCSITVLLAEDVDFVAKLNYKPVKGRKNLWNAWQRQLWSRLKKLYKKHKMITCFLKFRALT